ncbi:MAG: hypothetical protein M1813_001993 [Trichoglossum hirsutum]|nr:MAG: hypothetical protein M1813_001993 [Trichoglossum hirsutum]
MVPSDGLGDEVGKGLVAWRKVKPLEVPDAIGYADPKAWKRFGSALALIGASQMRPLGSDQPQQLQRQPPRLIN